MRDDEGRQIGGEGVLFGQRGNDELRR